MNEAIDKSSDNLLPLQRTPRRKKIGETIKVASFQELILPLHNPSTCWKILNKQIFDTDLGILSLQDILGRVSTNLGKYPNLNGILNTPRRQNANPEVVFPAKKIPELRKELQALSKKLRHTAETELRRREMPAGLKKALDDYSMYCGSLEEGEEKKKVIKEGTKPCGRPKDKDVVPKKAQKTQKELAAYIAELEAKHERGGIFDLNARTAFKIDESKEKSFGEKINMLRYFIKYSDARWENLNNFTPNTLIDTDDTRHREDLLKPEKTDNEMLDFLDNFVETPMIDYRKGNRNRA